VLYAGVRPKPEADRDLAQAGFAAAAGGRSVWFVWCLPKARKA